METIVPVWLRSRFSDRCGGKLIFKMRKERDFSTKKETSRADNHVSHPIGWRTQMDVKRLLLRLRTLSGSKGGSRQKGALGANSHEADASRTPSGAAWSLSRTTDSHASPTIRKEHASMEEQAGVRSIPHHVREQVRTKDTLVLMTRRPNALMQESQ